MKSALRSISLIALFLSFGFFASPAKADHICTANPDSRFSSNYNPIARFGGGYYAADPGCSGTVSAPGCGIVLDVTPRDGSNTPTNTHGGVVWTCTGFTIGNTTGDRCFHPRGTYTGTGLATCTVRADNGVSYTFSFGSGAPTTTTSSTPRPADVSENDTLCAYKERNTSNQEIQICVNDTSGFTQTQCDANATCRGKNGCTVTPRVDCDNPMGNVVSFTINDLPPGDLGAFIKKIFDFSLSIVGLTVFVMVIYGGFLMLLAGGLPSMNSQGKQYITNAFFGALLLFAAYVILNTINPNLVSQKGALPPLPSAQSLPTPRPTPPPTPGTTIPTPTPTPTPQ
jgi:hypothetical protein